MKLPDKYDKYFNVPGVPAESDETDTVDTIVLNRSVLVSLFDEPESLFDAVTMLQPLRNSATVALQTLAKKGIIHAGDLSKGCSSCKKKAVVSVYSQILKHVQTMVVQYKQAGKLVALGDQLRKLLSPNKYVALVIYLRDKHGKAERVEF